jgi:hypothetical protein
MCMRLERDVLLTVRCRTLLAAAVRQGGGDVSGTKALAPLIESEGQAVQAAALMHRSRVAAPGSGLCVPLFATSAVTGASLDLLHAFFNALPPTTAPHSKHVSTGCQGGSLIEDAVPTDEATAGFEGMQGWRRQHVGTSLFGEDAQAGGRGQQMVHFQIDGTFEVAEVGTGELAVGTESSLVGRC